MWQLCAIGSLLKLEPASPQGCPVSSPAPCATVTDELLYPTLRVGAGDLNSGPHICTASIVCAQLSPQSPKSKWNFSMVEKLINYQSLLQVANTRARCRGRQRRDMGNTGNGLPYLICVSFSVTSHFKCSKTGKD